MSGAKRSFPTSIGRKSRDVSSILPNHVERSSRSALRRIKSLLDIRLLDKLSGAKRAYRLASAENKFISSKCLAGAPRLLRCKVNQKLGEECLYSWRLFPSSGTDGTVICQKHELPWCFV